MLHNNSHKFESRFLGLTIPTNRSVMFGSLSGSKLGIWVAHGEGKFSLPYDEDKYNVVAKYSYDEYPGNPNGSDYSIAALASADGRHLGYHASLGTFHLPMAERLLSGRPQEQRSGYSMDRSVCQCPQVGGSENEINHFHILQRLVL